MTSGNFHIVALGDITVDREKRQRRDLENIDVLADSIYRLGLIHPLVVTRELELVAGERRYAALNQLGWTNVAVQYVDELEPAKLYAIELEENIKRKDISWQDQVTAVRKYHELRISEDPNWKQADTANAIGLSQSHINNFLLVAEDMDSGNKLVLNAPKLSTALGISTRARERRAEQAISQIHGSVGGLTIAPNAEAESILTENFIEWSQTADLGLRFNFIHCDFPYGIEADNFNQGASASHGGYIDTKENWEQLVDALSIAMRRLLAPSCHLMFWFSMRKEDKRLYEPTARALESMGWDLNPLPLIWMKSDGIGILPDPERGPRQIYETCFLGSRGDRKIVRAVANAYHAPTVRDKHMSEKPEPMLRHFFGMLVDENTVLLDPTCGSGSALRAAESLGAKYVLGLESNPEFADIARAALKRSRNLRKAQEIFDDYNA